MFAFFSTLIMYPDADHNTRMLILGQQMLRISLPLPQSPPLIVDAASSNQPALASLNDVIEGMMQWADDDAPLPPEEKENKEGEVSLVHLIQDSSSVSENDPDSDFDDSPQCPRS
jgi:hypothetical protein